MVAHEDESEENLDEIEQQDLFVDKKNVIDIPSFIELPPPMPPVMVEVDANESSPVIENVDSLLVTHELTCPHAELVNFWRPATAADMAYVSPYKIQDAGDKYVTFEPG